MKIVGTAGAVTIPTGILSGGDKEIPITSFYCTYSVGAIPTCRIGIPAEFLKDIPNKATKDLYEVKLGVDKDLSTVFKGYVSGRGGRTSGNRLEAGLSLVHPARDMDNMRMVAPGMHTQGIDDWSYRIGNLTSDSAADNTSTPFFSSTSGDKLPQQLVKGIIDNMNLWKNSSTEYRISNLGNKIQFNQVNYQPAIDLLNKIIYLNGTIDSQIISSNLESSINALAREIVLGSVYTQGSLWNSIVSLFRNFDLSLICNNKGEVLVSADTTNFVPPDENFFYSNQIFSFDQSSSFSRNVKEVNLISAGARPSSPDDPVTLTYATWPKVAKDDDAGASLAMAMPGWLSPFEMVLRSEDLTGAEPPNPSKPADAQPKEVTLDKAIASAQEALAHAYYNNERDKWRTMSFPGPLLPNIVPGTTVWVQPYSSVVALSGQNVGGGELYSGYLYAVQHSMDVQSRTLQTTLVLRNLSEVSEDLNITAHPIFTDVEAFAIE